MLLLASQSGALRRGAEISIRTHPSIHLYSSFEHCKPVYTKAFRRYDYKFKIGAVRILLSENTFAGHWETVVDCMENIKKCQQWLILPKNCLRTQLWFNQNIRSSIQKVPLTEDPTQHPIQEPIQDPIQCTVPMIIWELSRERYTSALRSSLTRGQIHMWPLTTQICWGSV